MKALTCPGAAGAQTAAVNPGATRIGAAGFFPAGDGE